MDMANQDKRESKKDNTTSQAQEAERHEFERQMEEKKYQIEIKKLRQARVDSWIRLVGTLLIAGLVSGAIQWYGIRQESAAKQRAERAEKVAKERAERAEAGRMLVQLTNARESAHTDLRARMFHTLLQNYFKEAEERERIAILELIGLNFRDAVQIKPMFKLLDMKLREDKTCDNTQELRQILRKSAKAIIKDQLEQIQQARDGAVCRLALTVNEEKALDCFPLLLIELLEVDSDKITVRTNSKNGVLLMPNELESGEKFDVTYFDMPMVDYTAVMSQLDARPRQYSIVLLKAEPDNGIAEVAVAILPLSSYSTNFRYGFDNLLADFLEPSLREGAPAE